MTAVRHPPLDHLFPIQASDGLNPEDYRHRILFGEPSSNIPGILSHPEIPRFFAPYTGDTPRPGIAWYKIISSGLQSLETLTMGMELPDSILLPYALNPSVMLLDELHRMNIKHINAMPELGKEFMPFGDTVLLYTKDESKLNIFVDPIRCEIALYRPHSLAMIMGV